MLQPASFQIKWGEDIQYKIPKVMELKKVIKAMKKRGDSIMADRTVGKSSSEHSERTQASRSHTGPLTPKTASHFLMASLVMK